MLHIKLEKENKNESRGNENVKVDVGCFSKKI